MTLNFNRSCATNGNDYDSNSNIKLQFLKKSNVKILDNFMYKR